MHRHPPHGGLGSNTCIQDSYNLAWKLAYIIKNVAGPALLDTYNIERAPIGKRIVIHANDCLSLMAEVWNEFGILEADLQRRKEILEELGRDGNVGRKRRERFREAMEKTQAEHHGLGIEMNQRYESRAVYTDDEENEGEGEPEFADKSDFIFNYKPSTFPGCRLPHVWLNTTVPGRQISTHDPAGHGNFAFVNGAWWKACVDSCR